MGGPAQSRVTNASSTQFRKATATSSPLGATASTSTRSPKPKSTDSHRRKLASSNAFKLVKKVRVC